MSDRRARRLAWPAGIGLTALVIAPYAFWSFHRACLVSAVLSALLGLAFVILLHPADPNAPRRFGLRAGFGAYVAIASLIAGLAFGVFFHLHLGRALLVFLGISAGGAFLLLLLGIPLAIVAFRRQEDPDIP